MYCAELERDEKVTFDDFGAASSSLVPSFMREKDPFLLSPFAGTAIVWMGTCVGGAGVKRRAPHPYFRSMFGQLGTCCVGFSFTVATTIDATSTYLVQPPAIVAGLVEAMP